MTESKLKRKYRTEFQQITIHFYISHYDTVAVGESVYLTGGLSDGTASKVIAKFQTMNGVKREIYQFELLSDITLANETDDNTVTIRSRL